MILPDTRRVTRASVRPLAAEWIYRWRRAVEDSLAVRITSVELDSVLAPYLGTIRARIPPDSLAHED